ncbi:MULTISPECIES: ABC transporter substrate-binding protein [unclassified Rhodococcus (in: high G+C Gram-positive bacteria)]|uniref:ABC transporter substrate-binding protein n=1 Tax=unclassified Rhodococcus (in: high G+C Gram-positive bacteria) TaxID=192944 RepID=UPI000B9C5F63|nr:MULTISPECIES: ABC transporter substrate-binding protein [unclassified Rhodococcus (in: high G+C Gram-positive bacteria)]OZE33272.1 hypothetical protein CH259_23150 [Rhodococcus sp. 05-2254-4]OZE43833.1 hypothetical protein CH261_15495 [Rhodococcus sp. 05-2254-3]OZE56482.1 hypothetical protein CH283_03415 [Rhodococcus sp. 05-2254-2]
MTAPAPESAAAFALGAHRSEATIIEAATRREFLIGSVALAALIAGCGSGEEQATGDGTVGDGYPRTIVDDAGESVVIDRRPQRVACVANLWDLDTVLALGVVPVQFGVREGFAEMIGAPNRSWEWHENALAELGGTSERISLGESIDTERIAAAEPDLIIGDDGVADSRSQLESLAPVVQIASFDWRANLEMIGEALDRRDRADELIADTDARMSAALEGLDVGGATVGLIAAYDTSMFYGLGHESIPAVDLFRRAGFTTVAALSDGATADAPRPEFSAENADVLADADVLVVFDFGSAGIVETGLFTSLPSVAAGRVVVLEQGEVAQGFSTLSPLNLDLCIDVVRRAAELL